MGYHSYLVEQFDTTHENKFFRELNEKFKKAFDSKEGSHVFIGNLSVGGHALDALFIKRGAIIVIDFKDYSGKLNFSENGPWKITDDKGKFVFVSGGAVSRNPYQQVKAYRYSLYPLLSENESKILNPNHTVKWEHTNALVLFQQKITFVENEIPPKIQRFFHVTDVNHIVNRINDIFSKHLDLTDIEIDNILSLLNIGTAELYNPNVIAENSSTKKIDPARLDRIRQLIPDVQGKDEHVRALAFYNTMISIERINESKVSDIHTYPIEWNKIDSENFSLNIESHPQFHEIYRRNLQERFPKNLFVSVDLQMDGVKVPLFYSVIVTSDIENLTAIPINFNGFILFDQILSELKLEEDTIQELSVIINNAEVLDAKISAAREYLNVSLELTNHISIGLSSESIFSAQLQSELNQMIKGNTPIKGDVFKSFVIGEKIKTIANDNKINALQVTNLNPSQKQAVQLGLRQPLTVVTGPPGTGKSQVVTNILANALYTNKKILFASKNNQAVDNVFKRINDLLNTDYFLRLGSSTHMEEFRETIQKVINKKQNNKLEDVSSDLSIKKNLLLLNQLDSDKQKEFIDKIPEIEEDLAKVIAQHESKENEFNNWKAQQNPVLNTIIIEQGLELKPNNSELNFISNEIEKANANFLSKLIFNLFKKSKIVDQVKTINNQLPENLRIFLDTEHPYFQQGKSALQSLDLNIQAIKDCISISSENLKKKEEFEEIKSKAESFKKELTQLIEYKPKALKKIKELENERIVLSHEILNYSISEAIRLADLGVLEDYRGYIENGVPWRNNEKDEFRAVMNEFLDVFKAISITNLTVKKAFSLDPGIFDLLIIDEASQCDIASALPLLYRAKSVVIIGDPLQLPHITSVYKHEQDYVLEKLKLSPSKYNYVGKSLFQFSESLGNSSGLSSSFLNEHYRCHPDIIEFSNNYYYKRKAGQELVIRTTKDQYKFGEPGLHWLDIKGKNQIRNVNKEEIEKCIQLASKLAGEFPKASIGIITPFKNQKEEIQQELNKLLAGKNVVCDTVHRFQGDEKDIVILSLVVTNGSKPSLSNFLNIYSPYVLNVAITRARSALYVVGNMQYCKEQYINNHRTLLSNFAYYSERLNN